MIARAPLDEIEDHAQAISACRMVRVVLLSVVAIGLALAITIVAGAFYIGTLVR